MWPLDGLVTAHFALHLDQSLTYLRAWTFVKSDVKSVAAGKGEDAQQTRSSTQERYNPLLNGARFKYLFHQVNGLYTLR